MVMIHNKETSTNMILFKEKLVLSRIAWIKLKKKSHKCLRKHSRKTDIRNRTTHS